MIERGRDLTIGSRYVHVELFGREVLDATYRLARWDRRRGRYFELHLLGRHVR